MVTIGVCGLCTNAPRGNIFLPSVATDITAAAVAAAVADVA